MSGSRGDRRARRLAAIGIAATMALGLAGCQTSFSLSDMDPFASSEPQPCPPAATLAGARTITEFGRARSTDESNVIHKAEMARVVLDCEVSDSTVTGRVALVGQVTLGRKGRAGEISLPVFVALTRNDNEVVSKRFDTIEVTIERGATTAQFEKVIPDYSFDLAGESTLAYEVLAGFNLTPEQIAYNRKQLGG